MEETGVARAIAQESVDRQRFRLVVQRGPGAMGVDVVDPVWRQMRPIDGIRHCAKRSVPLGMRASDVIGVARDAEAVHEPEGARAAPPGPCLRFDDDGARSLSEQQSGPTPLNGRQWSADIACILENPTKARRENASHPRASAASALPRATRDEAMPIA